MSAHDWIPDTLPDAGRQVGGPHPLRTTLPRAPATRPSGARRIIRRLRDAAALNLADLARFGPAFLLRHFARLSAEPVYRVRLRDHGHFHVRRHESDLSVLREVFGQGAYDVRSHAALAERLDKRYRAILASGRKPVVLDCGANIGAATIAFAETWPRAAFVAIEPDPGNAAMARRNLIGTPNHTVLEAAIGSVSGFAALSNDGDGYAWGIRTTRAAQGVPIVTIAEALATVPDGEPFLCKIDIEGFEEDLFARNTGWIDRFEVIMVEPHDWLFPGRRTSRHLQRAMADRGMEMIVQCQTLFYLRP